MIFELMDMSPLLSLGFSINSLKSGLSVDFVSIGLDRTYALAGREMEHNNTIKLVKTTSNFFKK